MMEKNLHAKAFVLAGGFGTRLRPITHTIPKSMAPINGKPILEYLIYRLRDAGFLDVVLSVGHLKETIVDHFGNGSKFGVKIEYAIEEEPLGTGGALKAYGKHFDKDIIMLNGDNLFDFDLSKIYEFHKEKHPVATVGLTRMDDVSKFGVAKMEGDRIINFIEKPEHDAPSNLVNSGIYMITPGFIDMLPEGVSNISYEFERLVKDNIIDGFIYSGKWMPCDSVELYEKAAKEWV